MTVYILSHIDFDGYASSEILKRYYSDKTKDIKIFNLSIKNFIKRFPEIIKHAKKEDIVYVADFGIDILNRLKIQHFNGKKIIWLDHHLFSNKKRSIIKDKIEFHHDTNHSSAYLVYSYLKNKFNFNDNVSEILAELSDKIDLFKLDEKSYKLYEIITVYGAKDIVKQIVSTENWNKDLESMYKKAHNKLEKVYNDLKSRIITFYVNNYKVGIAYLSKIEYASILADYFIKRDNYEVLCFVSKHKVSLRSNKINVEVIARELGGGGHYLASGAYLRTTLIERLIMRIFKKVPERIIEKLKKAFEKYYG